MGTHARVHAHVCTRKPKEEAESLLYHLVFQTWSLTQSGARPGRPSDLPVSVAHSTGVRTVRMTTHSFVHECWGFELRSASLHSHYSYSLK